MLVIITVKKESNDITATTELLNLVDVKSNIMTADTKSCQKKIIRRIRAKKADYVIVLKGQQPMLLEDATLCHLSEKRYRTAFSL